MKVRATIIVEWDLVPSEYPEGLTPQEMLDIDMEDDAYMYYIDEGQGKIKYELVE